MWSEDHAQEGCLYRTFVLILAVWMAFVKRDKGIRQSPEGFPFLRQAVIGWAELGGKGGIVWR